MTTGEEACNQFDRDLRIWCNRGNLACEVPARLLAFQEKAMARSFLKRHLPRHATRLGRKFVADRSAYEPSLSH
jgi:hypothetical protein